VLIPDAAAPPEQTTFGVPPVDVAPLYATTTAYVVSGLAQTERIRPRDKLVIPMIVVSFTVPGIPGLYTIGIDNYAFSHADPTEYVRERAYNLRRVWALPEPTPDYAEVAAAPTLRLTDLQAAAEAEALASFGGLPATLAALEGNIGTVDVSTLRPPPPPA
jgi:hypothetical protein